MDQIDRSILWSVVRDGRLTLQDLADAIRLSPSATRDRLRRLERSVIRGYAADIDEVRLGFGVDALAEVDLSASADSAGFEAALEATPQVTEALHATGDFDYVIRLRCRDTEELHSTIRAMKTDHGVTRTHTRVILDQPVHRRPRLPER